ncbi:sodium/potassium-transporting ATPase subunit gamma-like [Scyliorhinus torazame]|uniref:sodium/potassium-transporting ATPase subunit gamma-like n=1 Tax=Scyliorhinus torazame TaxID=75743 RepID=UPI003B5953AB
MAGHAVSKTEMISTNQDQFAYDYDTLRTTGLVLAIVMFVAGIVIALSRKFKCGKRSNGSQIAETSATPIPGPSENIYA